MWSLVDTGTLTLHPILFDSRNTWASAEATCTWCVTYRPAQAPHTAQIFMFCSDRTPTYLHFPIFLLSPNLKTKISKFPDLLLQFWDSFRKILHCLLNHIWLHSIYHLQKFQKANSCWQMGCFDILQPPLHWSLFFLFMLAQPQTLPLVILSGYTLLSTKNVFFPRWMCKAFMPIQYKVAESTRYLGINSFFVVLDNSTISLLKNRDLQGNCNIQIHSP